jgi:D-alanyl-D-alanine carboxypeptidase
MYCHSSGECREGCKTDPDSCAEGECDPADHTCKEPDYCADMREKIQQYVDEKINNDIVEYTGLIVGVDTPGCGISVLTTGLAVVYPETPMQPKHILPVASISKTFVAATLLQLVEEGRLSLNDTLSNWLPDVANSDSITVRHLLTHTSGVREFVSGSCYARYLDDPDYVWTEEELISCIDGKTPSFDPGTDWKYSNTNFVLLGYIIESETGNDLHEEVRNRLLMPLNLEGTSTLWQEETPDDLSHSYEKNAFGGWDDLTDKYNHSYNFACGDMASNAADLLAWVRELATGNILQEETRSLMLDCVDIGDGARITDNLWDEGYGLGIYCAFSVDAGEVIGHTGGLESAVSQMWYSPSWDSSVVLMINHGFISQHYRWLMPLVADVFTILGEYK